MSYTSIDIPFDFRHTCWFCGEPADDNFCFPTQSKNLERIEHDPLCLPACAECRQLAGRSVDKSSVIRSINECRRRVKAGLIKKYQKTLAIGANWTEEELRESEFHGSAFEGFKRSGWKMYLIARERINYQGWELSLDGIPMDLIDNERTFSFDGMSFTHIELAISHYVKTFNIDEQLLTDLVALLGEKEFGYALRVCRIYPIVSAEERTQIIEDIIDNRRGYQ